MTCIVAIETSTGVVMGADSLCTAKRGDSTILHADSPKVFFVGEYLIGVAGSARVSNVIQYMKLPRMAGKDDMRHMATRVVPKIREALIRSGCMADAGDDEAFCANILVAVWGHVYTIEGDLNLSRCEERYSAVGSGAAWALGSLHATEAAGINITRPKARARMALEAAERFCCHVRRPWRFLEAKHG